MPNYRYISQGEYFVTDDADTVLVTSGMTECIAIAFIDKKNNAHRLLTHFDGLILYDTNLASDNVQRLLDNFKSQDFYIHVLGGQEKLRNCKILFETFKKFSLEVTFFEDSNQFCKRYRSEAKLSYAIGPSSVPITMICPANDKPQFVAFSAKHFDNFSEDDLIAGKGLPSRQEQQDYVRFVRVNDAILESFADEAKILRRSDDLDLLKRVESRIADKALVKMGILNFSSSSTQSTPSKQAANQENIDKHETDPYNP